MFKRTNSNDFQKDVIEASNIKRVIVDFSSQTCGPCKMLEETINGLASEIDENKVVIFQVMIEDDPDLAIQHNIMSIPVLKVFEKGRLVQELKGNQPGNKVRELFLIEKLP